MPVIIDLRFVRILRLGHRSGRGAVERQPLPVRPWMQSAAGLQRPQQQTARARSAPQSSHTTAGFPGLCCDGRRDITDCAGLPTGPQVLVILRECPCNMTVQRGNLTDYATRSPTDLTYCWGQGSFNNRTHSSASS